MTVSVKLNSGSSLPVSSTVPFTSHRPQGAAWGSLADRKSKPEQSDQVADRLSRLKRPQVGNWVGLLYWFLIGTNLPVEWEEISDDIRIYDARSKKVVWAFSESLFSSRYPHDKIPHEIQTPLFAFFILNFMSV